MEQQQQNDIHIGNIITDHLKRHGQTRIWLAHQIPRSESAFCKTLKQTHIDTDLLLHISRILKHDFFQYYSDILNDCE